MYSQSGAYPGGPWGARPPGHLKGAKKKKKEKEQEEKKGERKGKSKKKINQHGK